MFHDCDFVREHVSTYFYLPEFEGRLRLFAAQRS